MRKNCFHIFRDAPKNTQIQEIIVVDTETKITENKMNKGLLETTNKLELGWGVYYNLISKKSEWKYFTKAYSFWEFVESKFTGKNTITLFAHNMDFDAKPLELFVQLVKRGWELTNYFVESKRFLLTFKKDKNILRVWDSMNYTDKSVKSLGKYLGLPKLECDFVNDSIEHKKKYCYRDVEIVLKFLLSLIDFLDKNGLGCLKSTISATSVNIYRHKFYDIKKNPIFIHNKEICIKNLERPSYKGGLSDCFKLGHYKGKFFNLDITSMYPSIMANKELPCKLLEYTDIENEGGKKLMDLLNKNLFKAHRGLIANVDIYLPQKYAYILFKGTVDKEKKSLFLSGYIECVLTSPELQFVKRYGKIFKCYEIAIYKTANLYRDFVNFFSKVKIDAKKSGNDVMELFAKIIQNSLYGRTGQKRKLFEQIGKSKEPQFLSRNVYEGHYLRKELKKTKLMYIGYDVYEVKDTEENSYDSMVSIASFVTAYSRMYLVNLIMKCNRNHVYYVDTDSIFCDSKGMKNLKPYIKENTLGYLALKHEVTDLTVYRPKFYICDTKMKLKGIKVNNPNTELINETNNSITFKQQQFQRLKTAFRKENIGKQIIGEMVKTCSKIYDKGRILSDNTVIPFHIKKELIKNG